uniref:Uncharacterized protein n=1 Tax=Romanomermis culicivorax TaxID=13658 RepID=A0A915J9D7_ROMCU
MFEHLPFLLDNATMLLARPSLRGSVPLDVAYYSFMDNNELALALKQDELEKVAFYLSRCGLQANSEMVAKGYPDVGWDPVEGERYIDFLRFCVWVNGESVEENANLVIRLLIRRPECLGPALKGEGQGLFRAFKEAITMSEEINSMQTGLDRHGGVYLGEDGLRYPRKDDEGDDYIDMGASILDFYSSLVNLLGKCAPDAATICAGKGESMRARAILRSLISSEDLEAILALKFNIPNFLVRTERDDKPRGLLPSHKQSVLIFLERVYGVDTQEMIFRLLEKSFLPDLRMVTMLDHPNAAESDIALALNRYLCNAVLPLLTQQSQFFADAEQYEALLNATLHTVYRMSKLKSLTNNQRSSVSDFLVSLTRELNPLSMLKLLQKVVVDIPSLNEYASVPLRLMTLHYERCGKYYGGGNALGVANEEEKRLTMILFSAIFDSLGNRISKGWTNAEIYSRISLTHPRLKPFSNLREYEKNFYCDRCSECLKAILAWNYNIDLVDAEAAHRNTAAQSNFQQSSSNSLQSYNPRPVDLSVLTLNRDMSSLAEKVAQNSHAIWGRKTLDDLATKGTNEYDLNYLNSYFVIGDGSRIMNMEIDRSTIENRFAYALLEKMLLYLDNAGLKLKTTRPSASLTRRNSFKQSSKDVKFFSKNHFKKVTIVVLFSLFCRLAFLIRRQLRAFGCDFKPTVQCLQVLFRAVDARTLVKINSDIMRTSILMFFNQAAEDLIAAVKEIKQQGSYSNIRGSNLKSWISFTYANQVLVPVLIVVFDHLARNNLGQDVLVEDIQIACYKVLDSLYTLTVLGANSLGARNSIREEFERHRPAIGQCISAFASVFPVAFLEPEFNMTNKYSILAKFSDQSVQAQGTPSRITHSSENRSQ